MTKNKETNIKTFAFIEKKNEDTKTTPRNELLKKKTQ